MRNAKRQQIVYPAEIICHQSVSSVMERGNAPASLEIAETRWPGVTVHWYIQLAGSNVPCVELTAPPESTIAIRQPPVEDAEPGKPSCVEYVAVPKTEDETTAPATELTAKAAAVPRRKISGNGIQAASLGPQLVFQYLVYFGFVAARAAGSLRAGRPVTIV